MNMTTIGGKGRNTLELFLVLSRLNSATDFAGRGVYTMTKTISFSE